ncbi:uncharacterized protein LOC129602357 [Paramacrobiotus metropolitanus]|uniref:uncharacterized protein LOC129602357 n=1 Tax=Paramacrobiotus metropolitanus TaxID=2943436 RepID=UPI00244642BF|nr:uncharacterized protein LOC129602357 [Paramacrobiotus metropolitanus]
MATPETHPILRFNPESMQWDMWKENLHSYIEFADIPVEKQKGLLLNSLEVKPFEMLVSMCRPTAITDKKLTIEMLLAKLDTVYNKYTFKVAEWAHLFRTVQGKDESLAAYSSRLRYRSTVCKFPADIIDPMLSAVFINGIQSDSVRRHLLINEYQTHEETLNAARKMETGIEEATARTKSIQCTLFTN